MANSIYIYPSEGPPEGPYSQDHVRALLASGRLPPGAMAGFGDPARAVRVDALLEGAGRSCPQCQGMLSLQSENPQQGTGAILIVLGILFAPLCIGIPILIWGLSLTSQQHRFWHCPSCGRTFPV
jgi:uncharacterized protein YbaR (Trm112 family)